MTLKIYIYKESILTLPDFCCPFGLFHRFVVVVVVVVFLSFFPPFVGVFVSRRC